MGEINIYLIKNITLEISHKKEQAFVKIFLVMRVVDIKL